MILDNAADEQPTETSGDQTAADDEPPAETASGDPADADLTEDAGHDAEGTAA